MYCADILYDSSGGCRRLIVNCINNRKTAGSLEKLALPLQLKFYKLLFYGLLFGVKLSAAISSLSLVSS